MRPSSHCKQMEAESDIFEPAPTSGRVAFLERFFAALERAGITYVVLHSYATLPPGTISVSGSLNLIVRKSRR